MATDKGRQNTENEDLCGSFAFGKNLVCVVCDGVGGSVGGRVASQTAVKAIRDYFGNLEPPTEAESIETLLTEAVQTAHEAIVRKAEADTTLRNMASTCLIALIRNNRIYYCHAGDCRIYRVTPKEIRQLTQDDSYMDYLIAAGEITPKQAKTHPLRRAIFNALGVGEVTPNFGGQGFEPTSGEYTLICSDGLYTELSASRIRRIITRSYGSCDAIAAQLIRAANKAGGSDNITAIVIKN